MCEVLIPCTMKYLIFIITHQIWEKELNYFIIYLPT